MGKLSKDDLVERLIDLNQKSNVYMERVANVLTELNDNNKTHAKVLNLTKVAVDSNTEATKVMGEGFKISAGEITKNFNRMFLLIVILVLVLAVLAGVKNIKDFLPFLKI